MNAYRILAQDNAHPASAGAITRCTVERLDAAGPVPVGSLEIRTNLGVDTPRYWFYVGQVAYRADALPLGRRDRVLLLGNDYTGARALDAIRMREDAGEEALDALLAGSLALLRELPEDPRHPLAARTIVELPGLTVDGRSPFWDGLGARFYTRALPARDAAERLPAEAQVASLLPRQPVVVSLLAPAVQQAIGEIDVASAALAQGLVRHGFQRGLHVNACDGGPVFEAPRGLPQAAMLPLRHDDAGPATDRWLVRVAERDEAFVLPARRSQDGLHVAAATAQRIGNAGISCLATRLSR